MPVIDPKTFTDDDGKENSRYTNHRQYAPPGEYLLEITSAKPDLIGQKKTPAVRIQARVLQGEFAGCVVSDTVFFTENSGAIVARFMKSVGVLDAVDSHQALAKAVANGRFAARVDKRERPNGKAYSAFAFFHPKATLKPEDLALLNAEAKASDAGEDYDDDLPF